MSLYNRNGFRNKVGINNIKLKFLEDRDDRFKELWLYNK